MLLDSLSRKQVYCQVDLASASEEAVHKFKSNSYDVVFINTEIFEANGQSLTKEIRQLEGTTKYPTRIVTLFPFSSNGSTNASFDTETNARISKPFHPDDIAKTMENLPITHSKSCENCYYFDRCVYDRDPGKKFICWKKNPRYKPRIYSSLAS